jgi:hypothetical protein
MVYRVILDAEEDVFRDIVLEDDFRRFTMLF